MDGVGRPVQNHRVRWRWYDGFGKVLRSQCLEGSRRAVVDVLPTGNAIGADVGAAFRS